MDVSTLNKWLFEEIDIAGGNKIWLVLGRPYSNEIQTYKPLQVAPMRFYYRIFMQTPEKCGTTDKNRNYMTKADEKKEVKAEKMSVEKKIEDMKKCREATSGGVMKTFLATTETKARDEFEFVDETPVKSENSQYNSIARRASTNAPIRDNLPNVRIEKMKLEDGVKTVKLTMISPKTEANSKPKFKIESTQVNDFKRLRSNDSEFGDFKPPSGIVPDTKSKAKNSVNAHSSVKPSVSAKEENVRHKKGSSEAKKKTVDDDSPDELSCSKSSTKKCYINRNKKSHGELENGTKPNLPTLKVDLTNLKTKITLPKVDKTPLIQAKSPPPRERTQIEETSPNKYEYAKNIGLLPVGDVLEAKRPKPEEPTPPIKEKKRKKMKHSKEPSEKRPKIHAEMIPNEKEPIKLKLKFTNSKPSKNDKKTPNGTQEIPQISIPIPQKTSSKDTVAEMRKVRHKSHSSVNSALNRTLSEQSMAISSLVRRMSVELPQLPYHITQNPIKTQPQAPAKTPPKTPPQNPIKAPQNSTSSPPKTQPTTPPQIPKHVPQQTTKPSPPQSPKPSHQNNKVNSPQVNSQNKPQPPKSYPGLMSPKATDRGTKFGFPMTSPTYNARPASFPPYPMPMPRPLPPPKTVTSTYTSSSSTKPLVSVLKRSSSLDTCPVSTKQARTEDTYPKTQSTSIPPLNRTTSSPARVSPPKSPASGTGDKVPYYTSSMGATYTHENNVKKPLPMLLPPSSISVTKMSDNPVSVASIINDKRPAVEIVRINSNTPAIDQQQKVPNQKTTRPPPATIPLVKIKKTAANAPTLTSKPVSTTPTVATSSLVVNNNKVPPLNISVSNAKGQANQDKVGDNPSTPVCDNIGALDLSGKSSRSPSLEKSPTALSVEKASITPIASSVEKKTEGESKDTKVTVANKNCQLPVPKLNEISKVRPATSTTSLMRQQNPSVRSIPNPSALAFRNQVLPVPTVDSKGSKDDKTTVGSSQATSASSISATPAPSVTSALLTEKAKEGADRSKVTFLSTKLDSVVSTKTPIVSHKPSVSKTDTDSVVSTKKNTIEQVAATLRAAAGDTSTKITKLN